MVCIGHSLGAALATLMAAWVRSSASPFGKQGEGVDECWCLTLGSPRVRSLPHKLFCCRPELHRCVCKHTVWPPALAAALACLIAALEAVLVGVLHSGSRVHIA